MSRYTLFIAFCIWSQYTYGKRITSNDDERCRYTTSEGVIDLNPLAHDDNTPRFKDIPDSQNNFGYSWNPCSVFNEDSCQGVEMCQVYLLDRTVDFVLGKSGESRFVEEDDKLLMVFTAESPDSTVRETRIQLECDRSMEGQLTFSGENPTRTYNLMLTSRYACPNPLTTPLATTVTAAPPTPSTPPGPGPDIFNLKTITILLACVLVSLCVLNCMVFLELITRLSRHKGDNRVTGHTNQAFQKMPLH